MSVSWGEDDGKPRPLKWYLFDLALVGVIITWIYLMVRFCR